MEMNAQKLPEQPSPINVLRIIHLGIGMGVALFVGIVFFLSRQPTERIENLEGPGEIFAYISLIAIGIAIAISTLIFPLLLGKLELAAEDKYNPEAVWKFFPVYLSAHIIRLAFIDGAALFAGIVLFLQSQSGGKLDPSLIIVQIPLIVIAVFFVVWIAWFPSREKFVAIINKHIKGL